ncbi:MAG: Dps family protein [Nannocystaceae bacterium]|nr:DNA starvation/stationary phase protection protein [bacterium]
MDIGIAEDARKEIVAAMERVLADTYTLYLKTHNFHWNVTGPKFNDLHAMFMTQYVEMWNAVDLLAERIRSLGSFAPGSYKDFARLSSVEEATDVPAAMEMVAQLVQGHETVIRTTRAALAPAESANDQSTLDLLTQRLQVHEKTAWMLRSLLA